MKLKDYLKEIAKEFGQHYDYVRAMYLGRRSVGNTYEETMRSIRKQLIQERALETEIEEKEIDLGED